MRTHDAHSRRLWIGAAIAGLSIGAGTADCQVEPVGSRTGLIQFDAVSQFHAEEGDLNTAVFARYWVCREYYAAAVVWTEPHGHSQRVLKTLVIFSDSSGFRMANDLYSDEVALNATYPKPTPERGPFRNGGGGTPRLVDLRFAEAEAVSRRVTVRDLGPSRDTQGAVDRIVDLTKPENAGRKVVRLSVRAEGGRIRQMESFDRERRLLCTTKYEYEQSGNAPRLAALIAELPARTETVAVDAGRLVLPSSSGPSPRPGDTPKTFDHVYHQGGRTCNVVYEDVALGDRTVRFPVRVEVRVTEGNRLMRSARLTGFKRVDLAREGVWKAARAFADLSDEDETWMRLVEKYLEHRPRLGRPQVDPNDTAFIERLIARYPVPQTPPMPTQPVVERPRRARSESGRPSPAERQKRREAWRQEQAQRMEQIERWKEQAARMPKPARRDIEPNDARVMRQLRARYDEFEQILAYHRAPTLPEDRPPEMEPNDLQEINRLEKHYETLVAQGSRGPGGQLKALHALTRLDRMRKDYDAFERHTREYLEKVLDVGLAGVYLTGADENLDILVEAGEFERANRLLALWAVAAAANNDAEAILRFARWEALRAGHWWTSVRLLDRFPRKAGLSPLQRYEGLALRGIALHNLDRLLASLDATEGQSRKMQGQWVLSSTSRKELAARVTPALRQAVSAFESLGPAGQGEARPYSTATVPPEVMSFMALSKATALQETSAMLDAVIRERGGLTDGRQRRTIR